MSAIDSYGEMEIPEEKEVIEIPDKKMSLDEVLEKMHSDENRLEFLRKIYTPEKPEIGVKIVAMKNYEDFDILKSEVNYAWQNGSQHRFERLAKIMIDLYLNTVFSEYMIKLVKKWKNSDLADYAIKKLKFEKEFNFALNVAKYFGKKEEEKKCLQEELKVQVNNKWVNENKAFYICAEILKKLGNYDQAIDLYLKSKIEHWENPWKKALNLAKKYRKTRIKKIAEKTFETIELTVKQNQLHQPILFVECAEILGKQEEAKNILIKYSESCELDFHTGCNLTKALIKIDQKQQAKKILKKMEKLSSGSESHLARLCLEISDTQQAKIYFSKQINNYIDIDADLKNTLKLINEAYKATGDQQILEKKIELHEKTGEYNKALKIAEQLGKQDLAKAYKRMIEMIKERRGKK